MSYWVQAPQREMKLLVGQAYINSGSGIVTTPVGAPGNDIVGDFIISNPTSSVYNVTNIFPYYRVLHADIAIWQSGSATAPTTAYWTNPPVSNGTVLTGSFELVPSGSSIFGGANQNVTASLFVIVSNVWK